ncbi:MAG: hypothetical protein AAFN92_09350 [Bacteroidota bacterium]
MRNVFILLLVVVATSLSAQTTPTEKPPYCEEGPATYGSVAALAADGASPTTAGALPRFATTPVPEYKVQVAILRYTDPSEYPFHPSLVARYRPCEQVWVVESRESFPNRADAAKLQQQLADSGYSGSYITTLMGYQ